MSLLDKLQPIFHSIVLSCRQLLMKLGNPVLRYNFRQGNKVADFLAKQGRNVPTLNSTYILTTPTPTMLQKLETNKESVCGEKMYLYFY